MDTKAIERAVDALLKWNKSKSKSQKPQLFEQDDFFYLILTLKKIPAKGRTNPFKISLPHPFHPLDASEEFCLIIDDRSKSNLTSESAKKKIQSDNIPISKVLKLSKLKSDYRPFEAKRKLCSSYDVFFADKKVIPLLPKVLGKEFFKKKKIPIPIDLNHKNWKEQVQRGVESALLFLGTGTCSVVKIGCVSQDRDELVANVRAAINGIVEIVPKKWGNVRSLHLKLTESLALPVYQSVPELGLKIEDVKKENVVIEEENNAESGEEGVEEDKEKKSGKKKVKKGRIHQVRYMDPKHDEFMDDVSGGGDDAGELGNADVTGIRSKKVEKKRTRDEIKGEKELKKSTKVKSGDGAKKKKGLSLDGEGGEQEVVEDVSASSEAKKKKNSKIAKLGGAEAKMTTKKKNKRSV